MTPFEWPLNFEPNSLNNPPGKNEENISKKLEEKKRDLVSAQEAKYDLEYHIIPDMRKDISRTEKELQELQLLKYANKSAKTKEEYHKIDVKNVLLLSLQDALRKKAEEVKKLEEIIRTLKKEINDLENKNPSS